MSRYTPCDAPYCSDPAASTVRIGPVTEAPCTDALAGYMDDTAHVCLCLCDSHVVAFQDRANVVVGGVPVPVTVVAW